MKTETKYITALIDGDPVRVPRGLTVLEAARKAGISIPTLCYLEHMKSYGGCRLCIVEIKGRKGYPTACTTPLEPGMEILTQTPELQSLRRSVLEMTLSEHPYTCLVCWDKKECGEYMHSTRKVGTITGCNFCTSNGDCELQDLVDYLELADVRYPITYRGIPPVKDNPFYDLDYNLCILCGRCVRICTEERNSNVLAFVQRGNSTLVGTAFNESQADAGCEFCGACVDVCPTGSISGKLGKWAGPPDHSIETTCTLCSVGCTLNVNRRQGKISDVGPAPGQRISPHQLCLRGKFLAGDITRHPDRITAPMIRKKDKWVEVSWEEAIRYTADRLQKFAEDRLQGIPGSRFGFIGSAQDTLEENYSLQKFARTVMKSNNVDLYGAYPDRETMHGIHELFQVSLPPPIQQMQHADTLLILGTDASVSHPLLENRVRKAFNNGTTVLYANTHPTRTSRFASQEIHYPAGKEYPFLYVLLAGLAKEFRSHIPAGRMKPFKDADVQRAMQETGIGDEPMHSFVRELVSSKNLWILAGDDMLRSGRVPDILAALRNVRSLKNRTARCQLLIPGYEGSLHGSCLVGMHPDFLPGFQEVSEARSLRKWGQNWGVQPEGVKGLTLSEMLQSAGKDGISGLMIAGDIPPVPALKKIRFLVQMNMFRTPLSAYADVLLPVTGFLENEGHFLTLDGRIKKLKKTVPAPGKARPTPLILSELASAMNSKDVMGPGPNAIWKEIRSFIRILPAASTDGQGAGGSGTVVKDDFAVLKVPGGNVADLHAKTGPAGYDHFRYRGNDLRELVPDLNTLGFAGYDTTKR